MLPEAPNLMVYVESRLNDPNLRNGENFDVAKKFFQELYLHDKNITNPCFCQYNGDDSLCFNWIRRNVQLFFETDLEILVSTIEFPNPFTFTSVETRQLNFYKVH